MASHFAPKLLTFNIIYDDNEAELELYNYDTVGDLKERIANRFNISPDQQFIHLWYQTPTDDNTILDYCCCDSQYLHTLIVEKQPLDEPEINRNDDMDSMDTSNNYRELENAAALNFVQYFSNNYNSRTVAFHICCLNDAIQEACLTSIRSRKILLLYFHNKNDEFSKIFCRNLAKADIETLLSENFFLLGWDVENDQYRDGLKFALNQSRDLSNLLGMIDAKIAAAFLIVPIKNSITIYSCMRGKVKDSDILTTIKEAEKFFKNENNVEENLEENTNEEDIGSENFQQLMLDLLGDRDYDSFDYEEHDSLKNKIGYALYGPPKQESGYGGDETKEIDRLYKIIVEQNNLIAKWTDRVIISFVYVCLEPLPAEQLKRKQKYPDYNPKTDIMPLPIFILRKCKNNPQPCRVFIDYTGRVYQSWMDYIQNNKLHKCCMVLPKDGRYQADGNGHILLERHLSPACGIDVKVLKGFDIATTVMGIASGGVFVAAAIPAIVVAPAALIAATVTGAAVGTYSLVRSAISLADRYRHKESMSFANSEARGAYINILAGSLGFVGAGANIAVAQLATQGFQIGRGATAAVNVINVANLTAGGAGIINSGYDVINQWITENRTPSLLTMVQLGSSVLFFGHALYSFRTAGAIIEESQTNALKDIQDSLRSNRHRKTLNKLLKETIRQNGDNVQRGRAEVISTIRNIKNRNEVIAALTRSNGDMKRYNVKFSAENGEIRLNGFQIDMETFTTLDKSQRITFLQQFSTGSIEQPTCVQVNSIKFKLRDICPNFTTQDLTQLAFNVARMFLGSPEDVKDKIINAVHTIIEYLTRNCPNYLDLLDTIFPKRQRYFEIFLMVTQCFQSLVNKLEQQYQLWLETGNDEYRNPLFSECTSDFCERALQIFQLLTKTYFIGTSLNEQGLKLLIEYFYTWFAKQIENYEERQDRIRQRSAHSATAANKIKCNKCGGEYYQR